MNTPAKSAPDRGLRLGAATLFAGYAALLAALLLKDAHAIAILLPLGTLLFAAGILCWAFAAFREARSKGLV
jgi:hypothetical protein